MSPTRSSGFELAWLADHDRIRVDSGGQGTGIPGLMGQLPAEELEEPVG